MSTLDISSLTDSAADVTTLNSYIAGADAAIAEMTTVGLDAWRREVPHRSAKELRLRPRMHAIDKGIGQLVDADMNEELTRLQALQVQSQLGIQALSIANQSSQNILSLFR